MGMRRILPAVVVLTALAAFATSSECPSKEELKNCECKEKATGGFTVHCYGDKEGGTTDITETKTMLKQIFPNKAELDLHFENFNERANLTSRVFDGLRVRKLSFVHCRIDRWADKWGGPAFVGLEDSLEEIEIQDSIHRREKHDSWRSVPAPFTLSHIRWLRKVTFYHNRLHSFGEGWFNQRGATIEELYLDDNEIRELVDRPFIGMENLRVLSLADNEIKRLDSVYKCRKLEKLDVRNNKIGRFLRGMFDNLSQIKDVDISGNDFLYLLEADWGKIWGKLESIDVSDTHLHCDQHINWMIHDHGPGPLLIRGTCATPGDVAGKELKKVIADRRINGE